MLQLPIPPARHRRSPGWTVVFKRARREHTRLDDFTAHLSHAHQDPRSPTSASASRMACRRPASGAPPPPARQCACGQPVPTDAASVPAEPHLPLTRSRECDPWHPICSRSPLVRRRPPPTPRSSPLQPMGSLERTPIRANPPKFAPQAARPIAPSTATPPPGRLITGCESRC